MKNFSGVCQAAGADKPLRAFFIWITNIVTLNRFRPSPSNLPDTEKENAAPIFCSDGFLRDRNS